MGPVILSDIYATPLQRFATGGGDVMHAMKSSDYGFLGFGEAYFSWINSGAVKAWKLHRRMTLNLVVATGLVRIVFYLPSAKGLRVEDIGDINYVRLTVPPGVWFGFQGRSVTPSLLLNIADIPHDQSEVEQRSLIDIPYDWEPL